MVFTWHILGTFQPFQDDQDDAIARRPNKVWVKIMDQSWKKFSFEEEKM